MAKFDQNVAQLSETFPPMLWGFYSGLRKQGFADQAAMFLTNTLLQCVCMKQVPPEEGSSDGE
jgi:hypothetical protein